MKLYLAHPIGIRHEVRAWELGFEERTGIELDNPFYDTERRDIVAIDRGEKDPFDPELDADSIVDGDIAKITECDGIVAYANREQASIGTFCELWETYRQGKPVYVVSPNWATHPWLIFVTRKSGGFIVDSYQEFEKRLCESL